jgi:hypothetical protein
MTVITKEEMNAAGCGSPGCTHDHSVLYLTAECHPHGGLEVRFEKATEQLVITCFVCEGEVTTVQL